MDKATICLQALNLIGEHCYAPDRPSYDACEIYWQPCYLQLLQTHDWAHARRRRLLRTMLVYADTLEPYVADDVADKYTDAQVEAGNVEEETRAVIHSWRIPVDCIRVVELYGLRHWRIYGRNIISEDVNRRAGQPPTSTDTDADGAADVWAVYTSSSLGDDGQLPDIAVSFCEALTYLLASRLALSVRHDDNMAASMYQLYEGSRQRAIDIDVRQDGSNDQHPLEGILARNIMRRSEDLPIINTVSIS